MATFHRMTDAHGKDVIRCYVKGAPDQLLARAADRAGAGRGGGPRSARAATPTWPRTIGSEAWVCG